jgi:two-component system chemotaxis response regulator CheY
VADRVELGVLVVEDEPEVRDAIVRDLAPLGSVLRVESADDVPDARQALKELVHDGVVVALVLADHRLPGTTGVDFLVELDHTPSTRAVRKVLITGQADHQDTIKAVNQARLNHYIAKPWRPDELLAVVRSAVTDFIIATGVDPLPFVAHLDGPRLLEAMTHRGDR